MERDNYSPQTSPYRWVVALSSGIGVLSIGLPIPVFGNSIPLLAKAWHSSVGAVATYGMDSYSFGVLCAFFVFHSGIFHRKTRLAMLLIAIATCVPMLIIPRMPPSLPLLAVLRFLMGWGLPSVALQSALLVRWFRPEERAISIAFPLGFGFFGLTPGGYLASKFPVLGMVGVYTWTTVFSIICFAIYFVFSREPPLPELHPATDGHGAAASQHRVTYGRIWRSPYVWLIGLSSNAQTWAMFTIGAFLPVFFLRRGGMSEPAVGKIMAFFGLCMMLAAFAGAILTSKLLQRTKSRVYALAATTTDEAVRSSANLKLLSVPLRNRLWAMLLGQACVACGLLWLAYLAAVPGTAPIDFGVALLVVALLSTLAITAIAFWSSPGDMFPPSYLSSPSVGVVLFAVAIVAHIGAALGPCLSAYLLSLSWTMIFTIAVGVQVVGITCSLIVLSLNARTRRLPFEMVVAAE